MEENNQQNVPQGVQETNKEILPNINNIKQKETYTLPSKGLIYKAEDGIPAALTLRRMTTREEKIRLRHNSETEILRDLLQACIMEPGIDASKLKLTDANYLLFRLRVISLLDDTYRIRLKCPQCGSEFVHQINLSEVPIKYLGDDIGEKLVVKLPLSGQFVTLKFPSLDNLIKSGKRLEEYLNQFPNVDIDEAIIARTQMLYVDTVNNSTLLFEELEEWFNTLDILDYKALVKAIRKLDNIYGFDNNLKSKCPKCGNEVTHGIPITSELFNPSDEDA